MTDRPCVSRCMSFWVREDSILGDLLQEDKKEDKKKTMMVKRLVESSQTRDTSSNCGMLLVGSGSRQAIYRLLMVAQQRTMLKSTRVLEGLASMYSYPETYQRPCRCRMSPGIADSRSLSSVGFCEVSSIPHALGHG